MIHLSNDVCNAACGDVCNAACGDVSCVRAAIDLGTVTSRLLVARINGTNITPLARQSIITHMGEGLAHSGYIHDAAIQRVLDAVRGFKTIIADVYTDLCKAGEDCACIPVYAVATSAMRDAANSAEIIAALAESGIAVEVIEGIREAELSFRGTLVGFPLKNTEHRLENEGFLPIEARRTVMTIDVGGGSTEVILGEQILTADGSQNTLIKKALSFDIGSRRITDLFLHTDPPTDSELQAARNWIIKETAAFFLTLDSIPDIVIAVAGVATTTVSVLKHMQTYDPDCVHGSVVTVCELDDVLAQYIALPLSSRRSIVGLSPDRAPVIIGGTLVLENVLRAAGLDTFIVSETDILQGLLLFSDY